MLDFIIDILTANYAPEAALADGGFIFLLILFIATTVISHVLTPKPETQDQKPAALGDIKFPTASEGRALPIPFGTTKIVGPNTLWYGNYGYQSIWTQVQGGDNYVGEYRYYFGMQIGLCRGPLDGISRISLGENQVLVETASGFISGVGLDNGYAFDLDDVGLTYTNSPNDGLDGRFRFYAGTETQNANPYLASHVGPVNTAAANFQFGIEEETTGNYWIRNTATEEKFGFGERIDQSIDVLVGDVIVIGEVNRLDNGVLVTPGAAYNGLNGEIVEIDGATGDVRVDASSEIAAQVDVDGGIVYLGATEQWASPLIASIETNPAYRGVAYLVWSNQDEDGPGRWGNSTNIDPLECVVHRYPRPAAILPASGDYSVVAPDSYGRGDANPVFCLYEVLTNTVWGAGVPEQDIDASSFQNAAVTVYNEGLGFSILIDNERRATEFQDIILEHIDGIIAQNSTGQLTLRLNRPPEQSEIDNAPVLDTSNIIEVREFARQSWGETSNVVHVKFTDRLREWRESSAHSINSANVAIVGRQQDVDVTMPGVRTAEAAGKIADREALFASTPISQITMKVTGAVGELFVGDLIRVNWPVQDLEDVRFRVTSVDLGTATDSSRQISAVSDIFQYVTEGTLYSPGPDVGQLELPADATPPPLEYLFHAALPPSYASYLYGKEIYSQSPNPGSFTPGVAPTGFFLDPNDNTRVVGRTAVPSTVGVIGVANPEDNHGTLHNSTQTVVQEIDFAGGTSYVPAGDYISQPSSVQAAYDQYWTGMQMDLPEEEEINWADPASSFDPASVELGLMEDLWAPYEHYLSSSYGWEVQKDILVSVPATDNTGEGDILQNYRGLALLGGNNPLEQEYIIIQKAELLKSHFVRVPGGGGVTVPTNQNTGQADTMLVSILRGAWGSTPLGHPAGTKLTLLDPLDSPIQTFEDVDKNLFDTTGAYTVAGKAKSRYGESALVQTDAVSMHAAPAAVPFAPHAPPKVSSVGVGILSDWNKRFQHSRSLFYGSGGPTSSNINNFTGSANGYVREDDHFWDSLYDPAADCPINYRGMVTYMDSTWQGMCFYWKNVGPTDPLTYATADRAYQPSDRGCDWNITARWYVYRNPTAGKPFSGTFTASDVIQPSADTYYMNPETNTEYGDYQHPQPYMVLNSAFNEGAADPKIARSGTSRGPDWMLLTYDGFMNCTFGGTSLSVADTVTLAGGLNGANAYQGVCAALVISTAYSGYSPSSSYMNYFKPVFFRTHFS